MFRNYLITALRNIKRFRTYSFVNLFGLSAGMAAVLLIFTFISHETGFDRFHENYNRIYRIGVFIDMAGDHSVNAPITGGHEPGVLAETVPQIEAVTVVELVESITIKHNGDHFHKNKLLFVDNTFFDIFSFPVVKGNPEDPFTGPGNVIITRDMAYKMFGTTDVIGKTINVNETDFTVSSVAENVPVQSHLDFDLLISFESLPDKDQHFNNRGFSFYSYFMLNEGADHEEALEQSKAFLKEYYEKFTKELGIYVTPFFQPLSDVYLRSEHLEFNPERTGRISNIYVFSLLALFILVIAIVNYVNLATARAETRSKEVAVRKISGANRKDLFRQFISESMITILIALVISVSVAELLIPSFGSIVNRHLTLHYAGTGMWLFFAAIIIIVGFAAGSSPALYLSRFRPARILSGTSGSGKVKGKLLKVSIVVFQFSIAVFLITSIIVIQNQVRYMQNKSPGFSRDNIVAFHNLSREIRGSYEAIKNELETHSFVTNVAASGGVPGRHAPVQTSYPEGGNPEEAIMIIEINVQDNYFEIFDIPILEGRGFSDSDRPEIILNQEAVRALGLEDPLGKEIYVVRSKGEVVGVTADYHYHSLHEPIKPIAHTRFYPQINFISVALTPGDTGEKLEMLRETLSSIDPFYDFTYFFMDEGLRELYDEEERNGKLIGYATLLSIIISLLGIYALTSFTIIRRTKEIGIRKAMGATEGSILFMLYKDLGQWVLLASIIGWGFAWLAMEGWLDGFAYTAGLKPWMFVVSGAAAIVIALATVTGLAVRATRANPVDALRYE